MSNFQQANCNKTVPGFSSTISWKWATPVRRLQGTICHVPCTQNIFSETLPRQRVFFIGVKNINYCAVGSVTSPAISRLAIIQTKNYFSVPFVIKDFQEKTTVYSTLSCTLDASYSNTNFVAKNSWHLASWTVIRVRTPERNLTSAKYEGWDFHGFPVCRITGAFSTQRKPLLNANYVGRLFQYQGQLDVTRLFTPERNCLDASFVIKDIHTNLIWKLIWVVTWMKSSFIAYFAVYLIVVLRPARSLAGVIGNKVVF